MAVRQVNENAIGSIDSSETWYPMPPVEWGRAGGAVASLTLVGNGGSGGTNGARNDKATTTDGNGTGLVVDLTIAGNVCSAIAVSGDADHDGNGYRIGDLITVSATDASTASAVTATVASLEYED
tara:strand:- start:17481 stop:17855 length:375 start_codon:yes stop_codon:yes gene_type:complete